MYGNFKPTLSFERIFAMKKFLALACALTMLLSVLALPAFAADGDAPVPAISILGIAHDQNSTKNYDGSAPNTVEGVFPSAGVGENADPFEMIIIKNTSNADIDLYDGYAVGYNGSNSTTAANFRHQVTETTFIGKDWMDGSTMDKTKLPVNPDKAVFAPGEVAIIWMYSSDSYKAVADIEAFRAFWKVPEHILVVCVDANSSTGANLGADGNFNVKNSATGTYMICNFKDTKDERFPADKILVSNADQLNVKLGDTFIDELPEVVSYVVVDFNGSDDTVKLTSNLYNVVFKTTQHKDHPKWFNATEDGAMIGIDPEYLKAPAAPETPETPDTPVTPPATGDSAILLAVIATVSLAGVVVAKKRASR